MFLSKWQDLRGISSRKACVTEKFTFSSYISNVYEDFRCFLSLLNIYNLKTHSSVHTSFVDS